MLWAQINRSFPSVAGKPFYGKSSEVENATRHDLYSTCIVVAPTNNILIYFLFKTAESEAPKDYVVAL